MPIEREYLTTAQAAELTGRSVATINRWAERGLLAPVLKLPGIRGARLFRREDVAAAPCQHSSCTNDKRTTFHFTDPCPYEDNES